MLKTEARLAIFALAAVITIRFLSLGFFGLSDPSEGRFASVALHMLQSGDWLIPRINYGRGWEDYLAKPPLHIWATALSFKFFGANETAARLPGFLCSILTALIIFLAGKRISAKVGTAAALFFLTTAGGFFIGSAATTDSMLTLLYCGAAFFLTQSASRRLEKTACHLLGFASIGLAVLTKGPLVLVLIPLAFLLYLLIYKGAINKDANEKPAFLSLGMIGTSALGLTLVALIAAPWYLEVNNLRPGFLRYYLLEENINRYLSTGAAIKNGSLKRYPYGSIIVFTILALLPWVVYARAAFSNLRVLRLRTDSRLSLFLSFSLSPLVFFLFARNILPTYTLPSLPWICLLLASALKDEKLSRLPKLAIGAAVMYAALLFYAGHARQVSFSGKNIANDLKAYLDETKQGPVKFFSGPTNSLRFYMDTDQLAGILSEAPLDNSPGELIFAQKLDWPEVPAGYEEIKKYRKWKLLRMGP